MHGMIFDTLIIERREYGADSGKIVGRIRFRNSSTETTIRLSEERSQEMLELVSAELMDNAKHLGRILESAATGKAIVASTVKEIGSPDE